MKAHEFDAKFESDDDILGDLDLSNIKRPMQKQKRVKRYGYLSMDLHCILKTM